METFDFQIDMFESSRKSGKTVGEVVAELLDKMAEGAPFESDETDRPLTIRYMEFTDGDRPLDPPDSRVTTCRMVAEG